MEKDEKLHSQITYNFEKNITGIEVSAAYINGLQRITNSAILNSDRGADMPGIFEKFNMIIEQYNNPKVDQTPVVLDEFESDIYTLFSLVQLLKYKAQEQGLEIKTETTVTKDELAQLATMIEKGEDVTEALKAINDQMTIVK
tara:strand:- start:5834 stop:6262 length:429 start_codon:yes stop_codon:yes gene_type:complete